VLTELEELSDNSLLKQAEAIDDEMRFEMLETIREYALERLNDSGEGDRLRRAHAQFFLELVEQTLPYQFNRFPETWMIRLATEHANLRAALEWCKTGAADPEWMLRFVWAAARFWFLSGYPTEGYAWHLEAVARTAGMGPTLLRGKALLSAGSLAYILGKYSEGREHLVQSIAIAREHHDRPLLAPALATYGTVLVGLGDYAAAAEAIGEALELARILRNDWLQAFTLQMVGSTVAIQRGFEAARPAFEESLRLARATGDPWLISLAVRALAWVASLTGDSPTALRLLDESIAMMRKAGDRWGLLHSLVGLSYENLRSGQIDRARTLLDESLTLAREIASTTSKAYVLLGYAGWAAARGQPARAAQLIGALDGVMAAINARWLPHQQLAHDLTVATIHALLDAAAWEAAYAKGHAMTLDQAIATALSPEEET
jgi:tetratricopeptide (TPR) repeat protein